METPLNNSNTKSETYCSHYDRDTCVMHFRCCSEDKWYPCHKCHNEAVGKEHEKTKDLTVAKDTPRGVSTIPTERSSSEVEENSETEGLQVNEEERTGENLVAENPDEPESNDVTGSGHSAAGGNGHVAEKTHEESDSLVPKDPSPSSPAEPKMINSVASVIDARQLRSTASGQEQELKKLVAEISVDLVPKDEGGSENLAADFNGHDAVVTHEESESLVPKDPSPSSPEEPKTIHAVASANDAEQLRQCTPCEQEQELKNLVAEDETESAKEAAGVNGYVAEETHKESDSLVPKDPSPSSPAEPKTIHLVALATDATQLRCTACQQEQEVSNKCKSCCKSFAQYFCHTCKLLIEKNVDAYHCDKCGICRGNKADHFHCDECNVCMAQSLKGNHKCFSDRGHDPCAICYEEVFSGAIILPCFHMIHKECTERLLLSGSRTCPMCRSEIFQNGEECVPAEDPGEDASQQNTSRLRSWMKASWAWTKVSFGNVLKHLCKSSNNAPMQRNIPSN